MKFLAFVLLAVCAVPCYADCPSTNVKFVSLYSITFVATSAQMDTALSLNGSQACIQFDLSNGSLETCLYGSDSPWMDVEMEDDFVIQGLPSGTPVAGLQPEFVMHAAPLYPGPYGDNVEPAYIPQIVSGSKSGSCTCTNGMDTKIGLILNEVAGQPFRVHFGLWYTNGTSAWPISSAGGTWHFEGLPDGSSIVSCHGFHQDAPVAAKASSWGGLKARYR